METGDRRLIEDYLPIEVLNAIAAREKLHPRRYVEMVHYWPARRPISAVRAAIYAALPPPPGADREVAISFTADRDKLFDAWRALANLADLTGRITISAKAASADPLDRNRLEHAVLEPLRELGLLDD